ncbi:MAG: hypothetical protein PHF00_06610 [Elusimicrobia bacterium]|nr:hypothetical protein [Elusimicrobiota bacterium]
MIKPDIVAYLQANLGKYPIDDLRRQLTSEGVGAADFEDSFKAATRAASARGPRAHPSRARLAVLLLGLLAAAMIVAALSLRPPAPPGASSSGTVVSATGEAAYVGQSGYVIGMPKGYEAVASLEGPQNRAEVVYFCKQRTDPTNFLHDGLFGQMGIVRLRVEPNPFAGSLTGLERISKLVVARHTAAGDKFSVKNIQVSSLRGIQVLVELPAPSVEAFIPGETVLYHFFAGQDDELYRGILNSLRDPHSEIL